MKPKLVLISHGHYAQELVKSAEMIVGEVEGVFVVPMLMEDGLEGTRVKLDAVFAQIPESEEVLLAVDLLHGTPCNVAVEALYKREGVRVMTGLSLPMAMEYAVSSADSLEELCQDLTAVAKESIREIVREALSDSDEEGGYED